MNWSVWSAIEGIVTSHGIRPIVAVVPDNRDPHLVAGPPRKDFWDLVKKWQAAGWTIALHGYQHTYVNKNAGMLGITAQSEFAGLPRAEQARKLASGIRIFKENGITCNAWVAPSHSFDAITLDLLSEMGVKIISDGLSKRPFSDHRELVWIPCQIWERIVPKRGGTWTVCCHHNAWNAKRLDSFKQDLDRFRSQIVDVSEVLKEETTPLTFSERGAAWICGFWRFNGRRPLRKVLGPLRQVRNGSITAHL